MQEDTNKSVRPAIEKSDGTERPTPDSRHAPSQNSLDRRCSPYRFSRPITLSITAPQDFKSKRAQRIKERMAQKRDERPKRRFTRLGETRATIIQTPTAPLVTRSESPLVICPPIHPPSIMVTRDFGKELAERVQKTITDRQQENPYVLKWRFRKPSATLGTSTQTPAATPGSVTSSRSLLRARAPFAPTAESTTSLSTILDHEPQLHQKTSAATTEGEEVKGKMKEKDE
jgi:hypothetical protein